MTSDIGDEYEALIQFLYMAPIGLVQLHADGEIVMVNSMSAQLMMPLSRNGEMANLFTVLKRVAPDLRHRAENFAASSGTICDAVHLHVDVASSGRKEMQVLALTLLKLDAQRLMAVLSDVTQSLRRDRELQESQAWIHALVTGLTDYALVSLDENGRCQGWNESVERVTGFTQASTDGNSYSMFYPPDRVPGNCAVDRLHEADRTGWSLDEGWRQHGGGTRYWGTCLIVPLHSDDPLHSEERAYSLIIRDVSDRREATEALRRSLSCDHLTGLANRRVLFEAADVELDHWRRKHNALSVVMIDADHFKQVNDRYGHAAGDAVLRHLATAMAATFGPNGTVARVGGEEFVALLPGTTAEAATQAASSLCSTIKDQVVDVGGHMIRYTVSAGVAAMETDIDGFDSLLQRADAAMYAAKERGRDRVERWAESSSPRSS